MKITKKKGYEIIYIDDADFTIYGDKLTEKIKTFPYRHIADFRKESNYTEKVYSNNSNNLNNLVEAAIDLFELIGLEELYYDYTSGKMNGKKTELGETINKKIGDKQYTLICTQIQKLFLYLGILKITFTDEAAKAILLNDYQKNVKDA